MIYLIVRGFTDARGHWTCTVVGAYRQESMAITAHAMLSDAHPKYTYTLHAIALT